MVNRKAIDEQFSIILAHLSQPNVDVAWSRFNTVDELIQLLNAVKPRILAGDQEAEEELILLLAPTGSLQEIAISNGWGDEFLEISSKLDDAI